jgi:hypothetical protein
VRGGIVDRHALGAKTMQKIVIFCMVKRRGNNLLNGDYHDSQIVIIARIDKITRPFREETACFF